MEETDFDIGFDDISDGSITIVNTEPAPALPLGALDINTLRYTTKFERANAVALRARQLCLGAHPLIKLPLAELAAMSQLKIAQAELEAGVLPVSVYRSSSYDYPQRPLSHEHERLLSTPGLARDPTTGKVVESGLQAPSGVSNPFTITRASRTRNEIASIDI